MLRVLNVTGESNDESPERCDFGAQRDRDTWIDLQGRHPRSRCQAGLRAGKDFPHRLGLCPDPDVIVQLAPLAYVVG